MDEQKQVSPEMNFAKANIYQFLRGFGGPVWGSFAIYYGPLMALVSALEAPTYYNGIVNAIFWIGFFLTQVPAAYYSERLQYKKWAMGTIFLLAGASMFAYGLILLLTGGGNKTLMLYLFLLCYSIATVISGSSTPLVFSFLFKIIPQQKLGSWLGVFFMMMSIGGLIGGPIVKKILELGYPVSFEILFMSTFGFAILMAIAIWMVNEPKGELAPRKENFSTYLKYTISILREDKNLVRFFIGMWLGAGHYVCVTYYARYAFTGGFGIDNTFAGAFVSMNLVGYMLASLGPLFLILFPVGLIMKASGKELPIPANIFSAGWVADKFGPKYTLIMFNIMAFFGVVVALFANNVYLFYVVWIFAGFAQICHNIGYSNMCLLSCPIQDKSSYIGLVNFMVYPFAVVVPILVGMFIDREILDYALSFKLSIVFMIASTVFFKFFVDNPIGYKKMKGES